MKKLTISLLCLMAISLMGCATIYAPPKQPICDQAEYAGSNLCKIFRERGIEPEQVHMAIIDIETLTVGFKPEYHAILMEFTVLVEDFLQKGLISSFMELFHVLDVGAQKYRVIALVLSDKIDILDVDEFIDEGSKKLILLHLSKVKERLELIGTVDVIEGKSEETGTGQ